MHREASGGCDFAGALWLAGQCAEEVAPLHHLRVGQQLRQAVDQRYAATLQTLESALTAACTDFQPEPYTQVRWALCRGLEAPLQASQGLGGSAANTSVCLPDQVSQLPFAAGRIGWGGGSLGGLVDSILRTTLWLMQPKPTADSYASHRGQPWTTWS